MENLIMTWIEVPYNKYCYGRTIIAYSDLTGKKYTSHYKNGVKNQYTGGIKCGQS